MIFFIHFVYYEYLDIKWKINDGDEDANQLGHDVICHEI